MGLALGWKAIALLAAWLGFCGLRARAEIPAPAPNDDSRPFVVVLGIAQDGGFPQAGCKKGCCARIERAASLRRHVASLGIVDPATGQRWLLDATPDFASQLRALDELSPAPGPAPQLAGIFLTHAHIGHYSGLMQLGREVMGSKDVSVYVMPRLRQFLTDNGPWSQLVTLRNIQLVDLRDATRSTIARSLSVTPYLVPHRDEYSETVGFTIEGPERRVAYIPDIDKWEKWQARLETFLAGVDVAYLDGTFYAAGELPGRDMSEIPHPFIQETMQRLATLPAAERAKVRFIHLNHTNPALIPNGEAQRAIEAAGFRVAAELERCPL